MTQTLTRFVVAVLLVFVSGIGSVQAETVETSQAEAPRSSNTDLMVRALFGPVMYSNANTVDSALGVALQLALISHEGFSLTGIMKTNFEGSGYAYQGTGATTSTRMNAFECIVEPGYSVRKGIATITMGLGFGGIMTRSKTTIYGGSNSVYGEDSSQHFVIAPRAGADFDILSSMTASVSVDYLATLGSSNGIAAFQPMAGLGYRF